MHKKFEINQTKIKGGCHLGRKVIPLDSMSDLPLKKSRNEKKVILNVFHCLFSALDPLQSLSILVL